jgi:hyperosmotically inducible periplasmic protein
MQPSTTRNPRVERWRLAMKCHFFTALCLLVSAGCATPKPPPQDPNTSGYDGSLVPAAAVTTEPERAGDAPLVAETNDEATTATQTEVKQPPGPLEQGSSQADLITTQRIREALILNESLLFSISSLRIVTREGKVTLRGTVRTARERDMIEDTAKEIAGPYNVESRLEIR